MPTRSESVEICAHNFGAFSNWGAEVESRAAYNFKPHDAMRHVNVAWITRIDLYIAMGNAAAAEDREHSENASRHDLVRMRMQRMFWTRQPIAAQPGQNNSNDVADKLIITRKLH